LTTEVHTGLTGRRWRRRRRVVRGREVALGLLGNGVRRVLRPVDDPWWEAGDGRRRVGVQIEVEDARPGIGDARAGDDRSGRVSAQRYRGRGGCASTKNSAPILGDLRK
jgi:hypothetical protein